MVMPVVTWLRSYGYASNYAHVAAPRTIHGNTHNDAHNYIYNYIYNYTDDYAKKKTMPYIRLCLQIVFMTACTH
jgi:hypothetical protein